MAREKKKRPLRVGIIGCGNISPRHLDVARSAPEAKLVACCDIDKGKARAVAAEYGIRAYRSYRRMIRWRRLDAVHICLPNYMHTAVVNYCLMKKLHVLSEKPMATDLEAAERTVRYAEVMGKQYGVVLQYREGAPARLVREALASGRLGKLLSVRSVLALPATDAEGEWRGRPKKEGGGILLGEAVHVLDLVGSLVGSEPLSVSCTVANRGEGARELEDTAEGLVVYQSGVRHHFYCMRGYGGTSPLEIRLVCEGGEAVLGYECAEVTYRDGMTETATERAEGAHARLIGQFYRACRDGEKQEVSGADALAAHRLVFRLYEVAGKK